MVLKKTKTYEELEAIVIALQTENMKLHHSLQKLQKQQDNVLGVNNTKAVICYNYRCHECRDNMCDIKYDKCHRRKTNC